MKPLLGIMVALPPDPFNYGVPEVNASDFDAALHESMMYLESLGYDVALIISLARVPRILDYLGAALPEEERHTRHRDAAQAVDTALAMVLASCTPEAGRSLDVLINTIPGIGRAKPE